MQFETNSPLSILNCNTCHGAGSVRIRTCHECHGMGAAREVRGNVLYWGEPITRYHIALRKARRIVDRLRIACTLLLALTSIGFAGLMVHKTEQVDDLFSPAFWNQSPNQPALLFWIGVMCLGYLWYRVMVLHKRPHEVEHNDGAMPTNAEERGMLNTWGDVRHHSRRKRINIAKTFSEDAHKALEHGFRIADKYRSEEMTPVHLFYALLTAPQIASVFLRLGISTKTVEQMLKNYFTDHGRKKEPKITEDISQIVFHAYEEAYLDRQELVHVTELVSATVKQSQVIQEMLYDLNIDKQKLTNVIEWVRIRERLRMQYMNLRKAASRRSKHGIDRAMTAVATPFLNKFSQDITLAAKYGHLSPCVARDEEIEEIFRVIEGGRQSVLLVGEHGVGKMSIIEGIAQLMVEERVPARLSDKRLVQLSTSALLAGTTVNGAIERLRNMMYEIAKAGNVILFINNLNDLVSGSSSDQGLDVSEALSEFLGPGQFLTFATTTVDGYNRNIANSQISTVFSRVDIKEMTENQAIQVLESKVGGVEHKHRIFFSYDSLAQSVKLAQRFLHDQNLPESAMDLMVEAASYTRSNRGENQLVRAEEVAAIVSHKTGIPTTNISADESSRLLKLAEEMHRRVIGQDEAVQLVANALKRARAEIRSTKRPIANFLFLGPTGVGKTELAKTIADIYFGGENRMIRIDMSEYQDKSGVHRLIGQPGMQGTGVLTEAVRQQPFSLVLLDEMEKADPDILNLFLQVFDDGRLTDSVGRTIDFTNTIIIATSNAGTAYVQKRIQENIELEQIRQELMKGELKQYYRPEFLNRFDGIVLFRALKRDEIKKIAGLMLKRVKKDLEQRGVGFRVEEEALEALAQVGFDPEFGARPMRRAIQDHVENKLAELVLEGKLKRRDTVVLGENCSIQIEAA